MTQLLAMASYRKLPPIFVYLISPVRRGIHTLGSPQSWHRKKNTGWEEVTVAQPASMEGSENLSSWSGCSTYNPSIQFTSKYWAYILSLTCPDTMVFFFLLEHSYISRLWTLISHWLDEAWALKENTQVFCALGKFALSHWKHREAVGKLRILPPAWVNANTIRKLCKFLQNDLGKRPNLKWSLKSKSIVLNSECSPNWFPLLSLHPAMPFTSPQTRVPDLKSLKGKRKISGGVQEDGRKQTAIILLQFLQA